MRLINADALLLLAQRRRDGKITEFDIEMFPKMELKLDVCENCIKRVGSSEEIDFDYAAEDE